MADLYIIMGSNVAGKSTVGFSYLPQVIQDNHTVFDGDKLHLQKKRELYKIVTSSLKEAGRLALDWLFRYFEEAVKKAIEDNVDFVYEGHLPEDANWKTPKRFKKAGYNTHIVFFGL